MWVVCQNKDDGKLFISSRRTREIMLSVLIDLGQEIPTRVLKEFIVFGDAEKYKKEFEITEKQINKTLTKNN